MMVIRVEVGCSTKGMFIDVVRGAMFVLIAAWLIVSALPRGASGSFADYPHQFTVSAASQQVQCKRLASSNKHGRPLT